MMITTITKTPATNKTEPNTEKAMQTNVLHSLLIVFVSILF